MAIARRFPRLQLVADRLVRDHRIGVIDALGDRLHLLEQRHLVGIQGREVGAAALGQFHNLLRQILDPFGTLAQCLHRIASAPCSAT
jgi:hypothetical protein